MGLKTRPVTAYLDETLYAVFTEGVLQEDPTVGASEYLRKLILQDLKARGLLTPEIMDLMVLGNGTKG